MKNVFNSPGSALLQILQINKCVIVTAGAPWITTQRGLNPSDLFWCFYAAISSALPFAPDQHSCGDWLLIIFAQRVYQKSQRRCKVLASASMKLSILAFQRGTLQKQHERTRSLFCTPSIPLLFCFFTLFPSGGLTPTEDRRSQKMGWDKQLIALSTLLYPVEHGEVHLNWLHDRF